MPIALVILLVAAVYRLPELALNPFHHDEGVNGFFTTRLVRANQYAYDPANYHGPSLYYFALVSVILFGLTTEALRLVPVVAGLATIALILPFRRYLGAAATLTAAGLLAISPGAVYMSRYFIHEALLVCFGLALTVSALFYLDRRRPIFLLTGAASAALVFATKETGIVNVAVLVIAAVVAGWYVDFRNPGRRNREAVAASRSFAGGPRRVRAAAGSPLPQSIWVDGVEYRPAGIATADDARSREGTRETRGARSGPGSDRWGSGGRVLQPTGPGAGLFAARDRPTWLQVAAATGVFGAIWILLFSSFFTNWPKGLRDSLATFTIWTQTGAATQLQPFWAYLQWMATADAPILLLGIAGGIVVAVRANSRVPVFIGLWAAGVTLAYSLIQYKTPWITLNMLVPLALLAGILVRDALASRVARQAMPVVLGGAMLLSGYQAYDLNFVHYADQTYPYVFVHTTTQALDLVDRIQEAAAQAGTGTQTGVVLFTPDYWPLPWYLRDYPRAGFYGQIVPTTEPIVVVKTDQEKELGADFTAAYSRQGQYTLRPGVDLVLYLRRQTFGL